MHAPTPVLFRSGLTLRCRLNYLTAADRLILQIEGTDRQLVVRLLNCWAPPLIGAGPDVEHTAAGRAARDRAAELAAATDWLTVWLPAPPPPRLAPWLAELSEAEELAGWVFLHPPDQPQQLSLNELLVAEGHCSLTRPPRPVTVSPENW